MEHDLLAARFEENRTRLHAVAVRMLGSPAEADDAVQEAWLRLSRSDAAEIDNLGGWLTTVVARICLDVLRARRPQRELPLEADDADTEADPEREVLLADAIGPALSVVLDVLAPSERVAFVLHDVFAMPFDEIAGIVGRSPAAVRQLASRARRRVQGAASVADDHGRRRRVVDAFLAAARAGDFATLLELLDPEVVLRADATAARLGGITGELRGRERVVGLAGRARGASAAQVDGLPVVVWAPGGVVRVIIELTITADEKIAELRYTADPERILAMRPELTA
jgi:RNA polymerase sigma-70 factor (ECF subfamily)